MIQILQRILLSSCALFVLILPLQSKNGRLRVMWRHKPATSMVIGWDQFSGTDPVVYYDTKNLGRNPSAYAFNQRPDLVKKAKGMNNHFVRLEKLQPNTVYYFVIKDSEGVSACFSFQTAPGTPDARLSIIAGGDSRNDRAARKSANKLVGKLRPHFVMFAGDMTDNDSAREWQMWLDDWQFTMASDGRLTPIVPALGNHEYSPQTLIDMFDMPAKEAYYTLNFGSDLLRVYTLNSKMPTGRQLQWLEEDLSTNYKRFRWKFAQYHHSISPHTKQKDPREDMMVWAQLFHKHEVQLVLESDAHVVKWTYPIRPFVGQGSADGFVRDDEKGTVYIGEGCWGAPLRDNNNNRPWTRDSGKFNQFKWIFIDRAKIEVRTVRTDGSDGVKAVNPSNVFSVPVGLSLWKPQNGSVVTLRNSSKAAKPSAVPPPPIAKGGPALDFKRLQAQADGNTIKLEWEINAPFPPGKFVIERKAEGDAKFTLIKTINSNRPGKVFQYIDPNPPSGAVRYRVKCLAPRITAFTKDTGCQFEKKAIAEKLDKIIRDPNSGLLQFSFDLKKATNVSYIVMNPADRTVVKAFPPSRKEPGRQVMKLDANGIPKGLYVLIIKSPEGLIKKYQTIIR